MGGIQVRSKRAYSLFSVTVYFLVLMTSCSDKLTAPQEIIGVWKTEAKDSSEVSIEFTPDKLIISSDLGVIENSITKIKREKAHNRNAFSYSVYYSDRKGETNLMSIMYSSEGGGTLRFKSDETMVWRRLP